MLCAIAVIDPAAKERLVKLAGMAEDFGIPPRNIHGHITLATYIGSGEAAFLSSCKARLSGRPKFSVHYVEIAVWSPPPIIVAVPRKEKALAALQEELADGWSSGLDRWTQPGAWQPHTTLVTNPKADFPTIARAMAEAFVPFSAQVDRIEFSRVLETGYEIIDCIALR